MPTFAHAAALADNTAAPGYRAEPVTKPTTPREYLPSARDGRRTESATKSPSVISANGTASSTSKPKSTNVIRPQAYEAGGTIAHGFIAPNVTVTSAGIYGPGNEPSSTPTPDGASTATTNGKSAEGSLFGNAGLSGNTPSMPKDEANVPATPRNAPATPIPVIASSTTCAPRAHSTAACSRSPASPAEKPDVHPEISAAGSNTNTRPPARTNALNASSCNERPTATAVTCAPSRANSAPAYKPSPPLSPAPANTVTRASSTSKSSSSSNDNVTRATAEAAIRINGTPSSNKGRSNCRTTSAE